MRRTYRLAGFLREEVGSQESASDAGVQTSEAVVRGLENGILEASGIGEVQMQRACLGVLGAVGAGTDVGLEEIKAVGDDSPIGGSRGGDGALGTSLAGVGRLDDSDLVDGRFTLGQGVGRGERREEENCESGVHVAGDLVKSWLGVRLSRCVSERSWVDVGF